MKIALIIEAVLIIILFLSLLKDILDDANEAKCRGEKPNLFAVYFTWIFVSLIVLYEGIKIYWALFILK